MWPHFNLTYGWHWATLQNLDDWATLQNLDALLLHGLQLWQNKAKTNSDWKDTLPLDTGSLHGLLMGKCSSCVFQLHKFVSLLAEISEGHDATSKSRYHDILIIKYTCTHTYICMHACMHTHTYTHTCTKQYWGSVIQTLFHANTGSVTAYIFMILPV